MTTEQIIYLIVTALIGLALAGVKTQGDRRYKKIERIDKRSLDNEKQLELNKQQDQTDSTNFQTYKDDMKEKNREFKKMLDKIDAGIGDLGKQVGDLSTEMGIVKTELANLKK